MCVFPCALRVCNSTFARLPISTYHLREHVAWSSLCFSVYRIHETFRTAAQAQTIPDYKRRQARHIVIVGLPAEKSCDTSAVTTNRGDTRSCGKQVYRLTHTNTRNGKHTSRADRQADREADKQTDAHTHIHEDAHEVCLSVCVLSLRPFACV